MSSSRLQSFLKKEEGVEVDRSSGGETPTGTTVGLDHEPQKRTLQEYEHELDVSGRGGPTLSTPPAPAVSPLLPSHPYGGAAEMMSRATTYGTTTYTNNNNNDRSPPALMNENDESVSDSKSISGPDIDETPDGNIEITPAQLQAENIAVDEFELSWSCLKDMKSVDEENEQLHKDDSDTHEELVNLADMIPNLVSVHRNMMYRGSGKLTSVVTSPTKAYSSKVLGFQNYNAESQQPSPAPQDAGADGDASVAQSASGKNQVGGPGGEIVGATTQSMQGGAPTPRYGGPGDANIVPMPNVSNKGETDGGLTSRRASDEADAKGNNNNNQNSNKDDDDPQPPARWDYPRITIPDYSPDFKPATGCRDASDFIVRCLIARLRSGITVVKHAHSRWAKSQMRTLFINEDGRSLTWSSPLVGERPPPSTLAGAKGGSLADGKDGKKKNAPKLDLRNCSEVRHAWTTDPSHTNFTGTKVLRLKCEAENAHKSFSLIFPDRTVDLTCITADQCRVLMEGFSALCYRLKLAHPRSNSISGGSVVSTKSSTKDKKKKGKKSSKGGDDNKKNSSKPTFDDKGTSSETMTTKSGVDPAKNGAVAVPATSGQFGH